MHANLPADGEQIAESTFTLDENAEGSVANGRRGNCEQVSQRMFCRHQLDRPAKRWLLELRLAQAEEKRKELNYYEGEG